MTPEMIADMLAQAKDRQAAADKWPLMLQLPCNGRHIGFKPSRKTPKPVAMMSRNDMTLTAADYICPVCRTVNTVRAADALAVWSDPNGTVAPTTLEVK